MHTCKLKFQIFLQQEKDPDQNFISDIPVNSNEDGQSLPVEMQDKEHILTSDNSDDQRLVVSIPVLQLNKLKLCKK
jgi:hypothetical protein